jgi:hypothetical protein
MDLIFRRANLPDGRNRIDVGIEGDRIVAVEAQLPATAAEEIDAEGRLTSACQRRPVSVRIAVNAFRLKLSVWLVCG